MSNSAVVTRSTRARAAADERDDPPIGYCNACKPDGSPDIAARIRAMQERYGVTQREIARRLNVPRRTVERWAAGDGSVVFLSLALERVEQKIQYVRKRRRVEAGERLRAHHAAKRAAKRARALEGSHW